MRCPSTSNFLERSRPSTASATARMTIRWRRTSTVSNTEKKEMEELIGISQFGAVRIQMIGVDHRHQRTRCGMDLLESITGLARRLSQDIAVRFLLADANVWRIAFYESAGFVRNQAKREAERTDPARSVSMRLDLIDSPRPA